MMYLCNDGYHCCDGVYITSTPGSSSQATPCDDCMLAGDYYVHSQDSVYAGCSGETSSLQVNLTRNDYQSCSENAVVAIEHIDEEFFSNVSITYVDGETKVFFDIIKDIPVGEYREIIYYVECPDTGDKIFGVLRIASKYRAGYFTCEGQFNNCTDECVEIDLEVS